LVEYQREGFQLWEAMTESVKEDAVGMIYHVDVQVDQPAEAAPQPMHVSEMFGSLGAGAGAGDGSGAGAVGEEAVQGAAEPAPIAAAAPGAPADAAAAAAVEPPAEAYGAKHVEVHGVGVERPRAVRKLHYTAPSDDGGVVERDVVAGRGPVRSADGTDPYAGTPRNAPCPCGSGKKYKMCHGAATKG
ncbi:MAG: SEC-C metal-binding domain-containing protein, partial [Nostocoides sp.]